MNVMDGIDERVARFWQNNPHLMFTDEEIERFNRMLKKLAESAEDQKREEEQVGYYVNCEMCGRQVNLNARRTAAYKASGHFVCGECKGIREKALEQLAAREEYLGARREAYHRARALRHGGAKLRKGRSRRRSGD